MSIALAARRVISWSACLVRTGPLLFFATGIATALLCLAGAVGLLTGAFLVPIAAAQVLLKTAIVSAILCVLALASQARDKHRGDAWQPADRNNARRTSLDSWLSSGRRVNRALSQAHNHRE